MFKKAILVAVSVVFALLAAVLVLGAIVAGASWGLAGSSGGQHSGDGYSISLSTKGFEMEPLSPASETAEDLDSNVSARSVNLQEFQTNNNAAQDKQSNDEVERLESEAVAVYQSLLIGGEVTTVAVDEHIEKANKIVEKIPQSMKANMVLLQFWEMKSKMLEASNQLHGEIHNESILEAAKVAVIMHGLKDTPERLKFRFAPYVYKAASVYARNDDLELCLAKLQQAMEMGFTEIGKATTDELFVALQTNKGFIAEVRKLDAISVVRLTTRTKAAIDKFESFPFAFELDSNDGDLISLADYEGKLLIVDFWGTWCPPCIEELPSLESISTNNSAKKVGVLCMTYERDGSRDERIERVNKLFKKHGIHLDFVLIDNKLSKQIPNFKAYPTKLLIDKKGKVRMQWTGPTSSKQIQTAIDLLLAANPG